MRNVQSQQSETSYDGTTTGQDQEIPFILYVYSRTFILALFHYPTEKTRGSYSTF